MINPARFIIVPVFLFLLVLSIGIFRVVNEFLYSTSWTEGEVIYPIKSPYYFSSLLNNQDLDIYVVR